MQKRRVFISSVQVMLFVDRLEVTNPGSLPYELTIDKLYTAHRSIPANPLIAEAMYLSGTIERMGTGTEEIANLCIEKRLKKPEFIQENDFRSILYRPDCIENVTNNTEDVTNDIENGADNTNDVADDIENVTNNTNNVTDDIEKVTNNTNNTENSTDRINKILKIIIENNQITISMIAQYIGVTKRTILRDIEKLKNENILARVGAKKGGHWKILK
jgi:predicted HTH transcriptional regulator